jgi:beta-phosphoglucomutase-like phosphatase (HAD superfamily)
MPYSPEFDLFYEQKLAPFLKESGYACQRADSSKLKHIDESIIHGICNADIIIADLTGNSPNVFYELGVAHSLPRKTFMISQSVSDIPFNLNKYHVFEYTPAKFDEREFKDTLKDHLNTVFRSQEVSNLVTTFQPQKEDDDILAKYSVENLKNNFNDDYLKILFIDLDGTLFDSYEQRTRASVKAFGKLFENINESELKSFYEAIYNEHDKYEKITGKNFRLDWRTKDIYRVAYLKTKNINVKDQMTYMKACLKEIDSKVLKKIEDAKDTFEGEIFQPYPYARQFLKGLKDVGIKLILVTEGKGSVQLWKLSELKLDRFFEEKEKIIGMAYENLQDFKDYCINKDTEPSPEEKKTRDEEKKARDKVFKEYEKMQYEIKENFHSDTIKQIYDNYKDKYPQGFKLAVMGDRYDIDLKPYENIKDKNIFRLAFLSPGSKYYDSSKDDIRKLEEKYKNQHCIKPPVIAENFKEAFDKIIDPNMWEKLNPIKSLSLTINPSIEDIKKRKKMMVDAKPHLKSDYRAFRYAEEIIYYLMKL